MAGIREPVRLGEARDAAGTRAFLDSSSGGMLGPNEIPSDVWELPPIVMPNGEVFGPRHLPQPGRVDPGGWHPGMLYGRQAWDAYKLERHRQ